MSSDSYQEKIIAFNGEVLYFRLTITRLTDGETDRTSELLFRRMAFKEITGRFETKSEGKASINRGTSNMEIMCCSTATDARTGMLVPCILLKQYKKKRSSFRYALLIVHSSNNLEPHMEFKLQYELKDNVTLLKGPTVLWSNEETVYFTSLKIGKVLSVPIQLPSVQLIGELQGKGIVILGARKCMAEEHGDAQSDQVVWGNEFVGYCLETEKTFNAAQFLPHAYSSVVTCMFIDTAEELDNQLMATVVAATTKNQLIWFEGGIPKDVCQLPFEGPQKIEKATTGREDGLFIVTFDCGYVCSVWKEGWKVASSWQGIQSLHIDDFVHCGTDQVLLLFETSNTEDIFKNYTVTDLFEITYSSNVEKCEDVNDDSAVQDNRLLTVQALEARLQSGLASLQELQQQLEVKDRVLSQSSMALTSLIQGKECALSKAEEEGLVSLWEEETCAEISNGEVLSVAKDLPEFVEKVWQRVVDDSWVVGVKLTESACLSLDDVSLSLLMDQDICTAPAVIQSQSNVLQFSKSPFSGSFPQCQTEPLAKKTRLASEKSGGDSGTSYIEKSCSEFHRSQTQTVTTVTDLSPLLAFSNLNCSVMLHATINTFHKGSLRAGLPVVFQCSRVSLNLEDISLGKYYPKLLNNSKLATEDASEDVFALIAVSRKWSFQIHSHNHTLGDLNEWLLGQMQCQRVGVNPDYLLLNNQGASGVILFNWKIKSAFEGTLHIKCSNQAILLKCLHSLSGILPPSCEIKYLKLGRKKDLADSLASALEKELLMLRDSISSLVNKTDTDFTMRVRTENLRPTSTASSLDAKAQLQHYREEFALDQELSSLGMSSEVDGGVCKQVIKNLSAVQIDVDRVAWELCKSYSLFMDP
ncbi:Fanconi anemia group B protein [Acipenser ruthenus]|uniref:Fanconi anemia group B protein n=1 Tax=Acipenser ruthenus TaxID=7906 RepID=A0A444UC42_ACIRT|nr:Fanconi anemia group B protein [Acipenser ruthenus]